MLLQFSKLLQKNYAKFRIIITVTMSNNAAISGLYGPNMKESSPSGATSTTVTDWVETCKIPTVKRGQIFEDDRKYLIHSEWAVDDLTTKKSAKFLKYFNIAKPLTLEGLLASPECFIFDSPPVQVESDLICFSPSGKNKAVVVTVGTGEEAHQNVQIWSSDTLKKTYDMKELDSHKAIYTSGVWGSTMAWSPDEKSIVYLAEKKLAKSDPFFTSYSRRNLDEPTDDDKAPRGQEYDFRQTWGEQLQGCYDTIIVTLNVENDIFHYYPLPNKDFAYDLQWVGNNSIIGVAIAEQIWRLGLIYCSNRESRVFQYDDSGFRYLSDTGRVAMSPRVCPTGDYIIWQERDTFGQHEASRSLMLREIFSTATDFKYNSNRPQTISPGKDNESRSEPALYYNLPNKCFTPNGEYAYFLTTYGAKNHILRFIRRQEHCSVEELENCPAGILDILWVEKDFLLVSCSSSSRKPSLELVELKSGNYNRVSLTKSEPFLLPEPSVSIIPSEDKIDELSPPSIYIEPPGRGSQDKIPVIIFPHGGPHSLFLDSFDHDVAFLLKRGFAIYRINYVGSIGTKRDTTAQLLGRISEADVLNIQQLVEELLLDHKNIDTQNVFLLGGSHGGFVASHLTSQYPGFYRAAVLRNPVIDLNIMIATSDITDWIYVEAGIAFDKEKLLIPAVSHNEDAEKLRNFSPITLVHKVETPTLIMVGTEDLRVPMSQGMAYYRALKSHGKDVEIKVYNDNHALSTTPVRANSRIQVANFFAKWTVDGSQ